MRPTPEQAETVAKALSYMTLNRMPGEMSRLEATRLQFDMFFADIHSEGGFSKVANLVVGLETVAWLLLTRIESLTGESVETQIRDFGLATLEHRVSKNPDI